MRIVDAGSTVVLDSIALTRGYSCGNGAAMLVDESRDELIHCVFNRSRGVHGARFFPVAAALNLPTILYPPTI